MNVDPRRERIRRNVYRIKRTLLAPFWLFAWLPGFVARTVMGTLMGTIGEAAGIIGGLLALAIAIPAVIFGLTVVSLVFVMAAVGTLLAVLTWPLRRALWRYRRWYRYRRWFYGLDEPGEKEWSWRE